MRRYLPLIAVIWGAAVVLYALSKGISGNGSYAAGQFVGLLFGVALVIAGGRVLMKPKRRRSR